MFKLEVETIIIVLKINMILGGQYTFWNDVTDLRSVSYTHLTLPTIYSV